MIINYNYLDAHGYVYGVQNRINYLQGKYSNVYYTVTEIDTLYSPSELLSAYMPIGITGLYSVVEITALYTVALISE